MNGTLGKAMFAGIMSAVLLVSSLALTKASEAQAGYYKNREMLGRMDERLGNIEKVVNEIGKDVKTLTRRKR